MAAGGCSRSYSDNNYSIRGDESVVVVPAGCVIAVIIVSAVVSRFVAPVVIAALDVESIVLSTMVKSAVVASVFVE